MPCCCVQMREIGLTEVIEQTKRMPRNRMIVRQSNTAKCKHPHIIRYSEYCLLCSHHEHRFR